MKSYRTILTAIVLSCTFVATAAAVSLNDAQKAYVDNWLADNGLNKYGDPDGTTYMGCSPLFDETSGQMLDRYEYVLRKYPHLVDELEVLHTDKTLAELETELEMAIKDLALEQHKDQPDKAHMERLQQRIAELQSNIAAFAAAPAARNFGILPEIFSEDVRAALDSNDYGRICELLYNLAAKGPSVVKMEAEHLFALGQQLRFRLMDASGDKVDDIRQALGMLEPMLGTLKV